MSGTVTPTIDITVRNLPFTTNTETSLIALLTGSAVATAPPTGTTPPTGGTPTGGTPTGGAPPVITPLQMPAGGYTGNQAVTLNPTSGPGPDTVSFNLCYGDPQAPPNDSFVVLVNNTPITGPLTLTSTTTNAGGTPQPFVVTGDFSGIVAAGVLPQVTFAGAATNLNNISFQAVKYNYQTLYTNSTVSPEGGPQVNSESCWVSNGTSTVVFGPLIAVTTQPTQPSAPEPTYTATASTVSGATINGTVAAPATLAALVTATPSGGTLVLPSGTIVGTAIVTVPMTIMGQGPELSAPGATALVGATIVTCDTGTALLEPFNDKGVFQVQAAGVVITALTIDGAVDTDNAGANAAGVRASGPAGLSFELDSVEIRDCQDGILTDSGTPPATWTLNNVYVHDCGDGAAPGDTSVSGDGFTHAVYFGGGALDHVIVNNSFLIGGKFTGHAMRTHAGLGDYTNTVFSGSLDPTGQWAASVWDAPDGGKHNFTGCTLTLPATDGVNNIIQFGEGTGNDIATGQAITMTNTVIQAQGTAPGNFTASAGNLPAATLTLTGSTFTGSAGPTIAGFATVTGALTKAVAPV